MTPLGASAGGAAVGASTFPGCQGRDGWHHVGVIEVQSREMTTAAEQRSRRAWLRGIGSFAAVVVGLVFSAGLMVVMAFRGQATVSDRHDLRDVAFGWPMAWVHQDQRSFDPPFPWMTNLSSPWEHPVSVSTGAFVADVAIAFAGVMTALVALVLVVSLVIRSRRA